MESIPVWGVEIRNELVAPFDAPLLKNEIPVGITPQEQRGRGTPIIDAIAEDLKLDLPKCFRIFLSGKTSFNNPANNKPNNNHGDISKVKLHNSLK